MPESASKKIKFAILGKPFEGKASLPGILQAGSRAAGGVVDPFINENVVQVQAAYELYVPGRGAAVEGEAVSSANQVIALEAADGATIFMRGMLAAHGVTDRTVWVADSFEGVPPPTYPQDEGIVLDRSWLPVLAVSVEKVKRYMAVVEKVRGNT